MTVFTRKRLFALQPWLVRAVIPPARAGSYLLYRRERLTYIGRSDSDLRRRLVAHAHAHRADYFEFDVHSDARRAFDTECGLFHACVGSTTNLNHPASPAGISLRCFICGASVNRFSAEDPLQ
jgi:hypothetical protein